MLYDSGDECTDVTGGWTTSGYTWSSYPNNGQFTKNSNNVYLPAPSATTSNLLGTVNAVPISSGDAIFAKVKTTAMTDSNRLYVALGKSKITTDGVYSQAKSNKYNAVTIAPPGTASNSSGNSYPRIMVYNGTGGYFYNVWYTNPDNWQQLCDISGVTTPADIPTLVADSASLETILSSSHAVAYMTRQCTGDFMSYAIASSAFLSAYAASPYKTIIDANEHWAKFLAMAA
jgi:hypothetical protein